MPSEGDIGAELLSGLLTREKLAERLDVCQRTVMRLEDKGLPVIKLGARRLYDPEAVRAWIREQR